jgi:hypothetical protein
LGWFFVSFLRFFSRHLASGNHGCRLQCNSAALIIAQCLFFLTVANLLLTVY